ncbi:MAG TPA: hypothetical protein VF384_03170 [Planctomycetota bacterium]
MSPIDCNVINDEAQHNHPCYELSAGCYGFDEVVESPLVVERVRRRHKDGDARRVVSELLVAEIAALKALQDL